MELVYPPGPTGVPAGPTAPGTTCRRHAWLAVAGLCAFLACHPGLAAWFLYKVRRMFAALSTGNGAAWLIGLLVGGCAARARRDAGCCWRPRASNAPTHRRTGAGRRTACCSRTNDRI